MHYLQLEILQRTGIQPSERLAPLGIIRSPETPRTIPHNSINASPYFLYTAFWQI